MPDSHTHAAPAGAGAGAGAGAIGTDGGRGWYGLRQQVAVPRMAAALMMVLGRRDTGETRGKTRGKTRGLTFTVGLKVFNNI